MQRNRPRDIIANETEPRDARIILHDPPERGLGILRHRVGLIKDNDLVRWTRVVGNGCGDGDFGEALDLFANNCDAPFVRSVKLEHARSKNFGSKELFGKSQDC